MVPYSSFMTIEKNPKVQMKITDITCTILHKPSVVFPAAGYTTGRCHSGHSGVSAFDLAQKAMTRMGRSFL